MPDTHLTLAEYKKLGLKNQPDAALWGMAHSYRENIAGTSDPALAVQYEDGLRTVLGVLEDRHPTAFRYGHR